MFSIVDIAKGKKDVHTILTDIDNVTREEFDEAKTYISTVKINDVNQETVNFIEENGMIAKVSDGVNEYIMTDTTGFATKEELNNKVTINSSSVDVNFIEREIVQNGLIGSYIGIREKLSIAFPDIYTGGTLYCEFDIYIPSDTGAVYTFGFGLGAHSYINQSQPMYRGKWVHCTVIRTETSITHTLDGANRKVYSEGNVGPVNTLGIGDHSRSDRKIAADIRNILIYNRMPTQQEINHNRSVLNNQSSIEQISTYEQTYVFGTDIKHVLTPIGYTQEEVYTEFMKARSREFTTNNGILNVENVIDNHKILGLSVKGITVNNILPTEDEVTLVGNGDVYVDRILEISTTLKPDTVYTLITDITSNSLINNLISCHMIASNTWLNVSGCIENLKIPGGTTGLVKQTLKTKSNLVGLENTLRSIIGPGGSETGVITFRQMLLEGDWLNKVIPNSYISHGFNSPKAILDVNSIKYTFYDSNNIIELGSVGDSCDTLELKSDGSVVYTNVLENGIATSDCTITIHTIGTPAEGFTKFLITIPSMTGLVSSKINVISEKLPSIDWNSMYNGIISCNCIARLSNAICISVKNEIASTVGEFKSYLDNIGGIPYKTIKATPTITQLPKVFIPTSNDQMNFFVGDEQLKIHNLSVLVPVYNIEDIQTQLNDINDIVMQLSSLLL